MTRLNLGSNKGLLISLLSISTNALDLSAVDKLPLCQGGHITSQSGLERQVPNANCRWRIESEQSKKIKVTFHELTRDCSNDEDEIYLLDAQRSVFGPFCSLAANYNRHRRTAVNFEHEVDLPESADEIEGIFDGDAVEVVYVTAPGGYKFRFKFYFEWELIEMPSANGTLVAIGDNEREPIFPDGVNVHSVPTTGICGPEHFAPAALGIFATELDSTAAPETAMEGFSKFAAAMTGFDKYFDSHFAEYCALESTQLPCEFFHFQDDVTAQFLFGHLEALVGHIISHCDDGFGHLWLKELSELESWIGGEIPTVIVPEFNQVTVKDGNLCDECLVDADCGDFHEKWMRCSSETKQCVCGNHWVDANGDPTDGCEAFSGDYTLNHNQCSGENPPKTTTTVKTTTTTNKWQTTSKPTTTTTKTTTTKSTTEATIPSLCGSCSSNSDCGKKSKYHMVCSDEGQCICDNQWISTSENNFDGCRTFSAGYEKDQEQCSPKTTTAPQNIDETTAIVDHAKVFNVIEVGNNCPQQWLKTPMEDDNNLWNEFDDGLHEHDEPMCAFENLPACTKPLFAGVAASACHSSTLISNYNAVADELARVSVSGDFDRTCVFAIARAPCSALDFKAISDPREYAYKFAEVVKTFAIEKCGKSHLKNSLGPMLMQNVEILENAANGNCPAELGDFVFDAEAFDETDFSDVPVHTTTTTTVAPEKDVQQTTPKSIDGKFTTLKDGQCTSKAYGRLATVVFDARAFDLVDADTAKANFKRFADEIGRLGKKTQKYEMQRGERPDCEVATSGKMPCELLDFPSKEMACQLAERAKKLYLHVRTSCNNAWINIYGQTISSLVEAAEPVSGSCPQIGERMEKQLLQEYTERHAEENDGVDFKQQIKEIRDAVKEDKAERKRERGSKKMRREDREKNKLKNMARRRIESAMVEVNKKQQKLEQLRIAIAAAEAGNYALLARDEENDVVVEENDSGMLMDFGGELYESYEYGEYEEEEEGECAVPVALEIDSAVEFFNALVEAQTSPRSKLLHNAVSHRVKRRFEDVLNFIRVAPGHCPEEVLASCANVNLVYGKRRAKITEIIEAASQIVQNIEEQCEGASFAEFFLSVHGKAENLF